MEFIGIIVAVFIGLAILLMFIGLRSMLPEDDNSNRIYDIVQQTGMAADTGGGRVEGGFSGKRALTAVNKELLARGFGKGVTANLLQADLKITATEYMLLISGITLLGALLGYAVSKHPISALIAGLISFFFLPAYVSWRKAKRRKMFADQLPDALSSMASSLRAGYSIIQSLDVIRKQMPWPIRDEFARIVREVQLGLPLSVALTHLGERVYSDDIVMVISSINIQQQIGGNLAEILDTVAETIRERVRIKREIEVLTAQQRISGYVLVVLPIALGAFLLIVNPDYEMRLFTPGLTLCIPIGAGLSIITGFLIMRRIVDIEV
jgi:tight adherence protein B